MAGEELGNALNKHILLYLPDYLTNYTGPDLFGNPAPMWFNRPPTSLKMYRRRSASKKGKTRRRKRREMQKASRHKNRR